MVSCSGSRFATWWLYGICNELSDDVSPISTMGLKTFQLAAPLGCKQSSSRQNWCLSLKQCRGTKHLPLNAYLASCPTWSKMKSCFIFRNFSLNVDQWGSMSMLEFGFIFTHFLIGQHSNWNNFSFWPFLQGFGPIMFMLVDRGTTWRDKSWKFP